MTSSGVMIARQSNPFGQARFQQARQRRSTAAAVTAELAKGATPLQAAVTAKDVVSASIGMRGNIPFPYVYQGWYQA